MALADLPAGYAILPLRTPTLPPATHTNCVLVGGRETLLIDPGSSFPGEIARIARQLAGISRHRGKLAAIFVTHHHGDHHAGSVLLAREHGAVVVAHALTLDRMKLPGEIGRRSVDDGTRLPIGASHELRVLVTPGHAEGHLCLFDERTAVLIAGDMVPGKGTSVISPPEGDMVAYLASLRRLAELNPQIILPGHGPPRYEGRRWIEQLIAHRLQRELRILEALSAVPRDLLAVTCAAYTDVSPLLWPLAARSALAHLLKLEGEGLARRVDGARWVRR